MCNMKLLLLLTLWGVTSAHEITQLNVPMYADPRRAAELSCHFFMDNQKLHSVKWYRDMDEIFRYYPSQKSSILLFNVTTRDEHSVPVMVQDNDCQADSCTIRVMPAPISVRAAYTCEVSTEGPKFKIARKTKHMTVVAMPEEDPVITGAPKVIKPGEQMLLNCSSDYSLPSSEISWYIDDELQNSESRQHTEVSAPVIGGLRTSWKVLRVRVPSVASGSIRVRCEAVVPVEPPVVRDAVVVITIHSTTQLSKYTANTGMTTKMDVVLSLVTFVIFATEMVTLNL